MQREQREHVTIYLTLSECLMLDDAVQVSGSCGTEL